MRNNIATAVLTIGHIFIGIIDVRAPVNEVHIAMTINIPADIRYKRVETEFCEPTIAVISNTSRPIKHKVIPSAAHSIVIILVLSSDISPKPLTTDLVGMICAMPHIKIIAEPIYNEISTLSKPHKNIFYDNLHVGA